MDLLQPTQLIHRLALILPRMRRPVRILVLWVVRRSISLGVNNEGFLVLCSTSTEAIHTVLIDWPDANGWENWSHVWFKRSDDISLLCGDNTKVGGW